MTGIRPEVVEHANGILASLDMMELVCLDADTHTVDEAVYLRHVGMQMAAKAKRMMEFLDLHLLDVLEEPIDHAGWQFRRGRKKESERYDHDEILTQLRTQVLEESWEGEFKGEAALLAELAERFRNVYLSDSTKAKVGQLDRYGIPRDPRNDDSVRTFRKGDRYIDVSPIMSEVQE